MGPGKLFDPRAVCAILAIRTLERSKVQDDQAQQKAEGEVKVESEWSGLGPGWFFDPHAVGDLFPDRVVTHEILHNSYVCMYVRLIWQ